jgi:hypothetical protein
MHIVIGKQTVCVRSIINPEEKNLTSDANKGMIGWSVRTGTDNSAAELPPARIAPNQPSCTIDHKGLITSFTYVDRNLQILPYQQN